MSEVAAEYAALTTARDRLTSIAEALQQERTSLDTSTHAMLDGDWTGPAAEAYRTAFSEWSEGADVVLSGLHSMGGLIDHARVTLQRQDDAVTTEVSRIRSRLGG